MAMTTEPIRDKKHLKQLAKYFLSRGEYRNHLLLVFCSHTALRISDILQITLESVVDEERGDFCTHLTLTETKTGKSKTIAIHPKIIEALKLYLPHKRGEFLFTGNRSNMAAISRVQAWRILNVAAKEIGLGLKVSAHALRKTFGYHAWQNGISPVLLMEIYNHSSYEVTRRYLGIAQDDTDKVYLAVNMF